LLRTAVVCIGLAEVFSPPNQKSVSRLADPAESEPWTQFLVSSVPKRPLIEVGAWALQVIEWVGPITWRHFLTASAATSSKPMQTSLVIRLNRSGKKAFPTCSA